jgi:hypothetical protein
VLEGFHQGILERVFCVFVIPGHAVDASEDASGVTCAKFGEGPLLAGLIVEHALAGEIDDLRERMIGVEMFGRRVDYDTSNDAVVRVRATEVRRRLGRYYAELGRSPVLRIELPSGSYVPKFHWSPSEQSTESRNEPISAPLTEESPAQEHAQKAENSPVARPGLRRTPRNTAATLAALAIIAATAYIGYKAWSK